MKFGLINGNHEWGGGERWFRDAARALGERGHALVLVAQRDTRLFDQFALLGHPVLDVDQLASGLGDPPPDLVLCNSPKDLRSLLGLIGTRPPFRLLMRRGIDRPLNNMPHRRRGWRCLSGILANSQATAHTVKSSLPWFPEDRIHTIYNPVRIARLDPVPATGPEYRLGAVGRFVRQKGFLILLEALARIGAELPWRLEIAGDGKKRSELERRCRKLGLTDAVTLLGHLEDLAPFYARQDAIVIPSLYEGFGFAAVDAALCGLPVIASDVSSLREVVSDGRSGVLVPPRDPGALARAIVELGTRPGWGRELGAAARQLAEPRFDPERIHDELDRFLQEAAKWPPVGKGIARRRP